MKRKHKPGSKRQKAVWKWPEFPDRYLEQLREAGLFAIRDYHGDPMVFKPAAVPGNSLPGYENEPPDWPVDVARPDFPASDAPHNYVWHDGSKWYVSEDGQPIGGPSRGRAYGTPAEVVADLLDYYFGDPARMQEWARLQTPEGRAAAYAAERARDPKADLCHVKGCVEPNVGYSPFCGRHRKPEWWERYRL